MSTHTQKNTRRGRPADIETRIADARCAIDLAEEVLLKGTREVIVMVNATVRDLRDARAFVDGYTTGGVA